VLDKAGLHVPQRHDPGVAAIDPFGHDHVLLSVEDYPLLVPLTANEGTKSGNPTDKLAA